MKKILVFGSFSTSVKVEIQNVKIGSLGGARNVKNCPHNNSFDFVLKRYLAFTLVELLVVIAIIGVLIALLLPAVQAAREAARRMQCSNHERQIGLAVHNFHDATGGLPPYNIGLISGDSAVAINGSLGFFGTIFPFIEQQALYDLIANNPTDSNDNVGFAVPLDNTWWDGLTEEQRNSFGSLPFLKCPARRSGKQLISNFDGFDPSNIFTALPPEYLTMYQGRYLKGPRGDYAIVVFDIVSPPPPMGFSRMDVATGNGVLAASSVSTYNNYLKEIRSPFRTAIHTLTTGSTNTLSWEPRDKFDSISDGLTNQLFLGEKYIPLSKIGVWAFNQGYDGSVLASTSTVSNTFARHLFRYSATASPTYLARNTNELSSLSPTSSSFPQFGSNHAGIVNFLVGDGSVRPIAVTTNRDILEALGDTQDGVPVSLP